MILRGRRDRCEGGFAVDFSRSRYVTLRGLAISGAGVRGIGLRGGSRQNRAIHLERNRLSRGGPRECNGGIDVGRGYPDTVIAHNLIYGNGQNGIIFRDGRGGPYYVIGNTIVGSVERRADDAPRGRRADRQPDPRQPARQVTTTVRTSGRLIGCATLLVTRALLKLPVEELLLVPGLFSSGSGLGTTLAEAQRARRGLASLRNALDQTFARTGIGCPRVIRALPY